MYVVYVRKERRERERRGERISTVRGGSDKERAGKKGDYVAHNMNMPPPLFLYLYL